jgi:hypothetical protein
MLVSTIIGFITVFQVRANASGLGLRHWSAFVVLFSVGAALVVTLVEAALGRIEVPLLETWGILALQILTVASFASAAVVLAGRWAILPTWLFFVVLGNSASGGAVAAPLLPRPFAIVSQWLPSGPRSRRSGTRSTSTASSTRSRSSCWRPGPWCCSP